jgi:hypothetical protein
VNYIATTFEKLNKEMGAGIALAFIFAILSLQFFIGGWMLQYSFQYWIGLARDNPVVVPFAACGLAACISPLQKLYLTLFFITWLVRIAN